MLFEIPKPVVFRILYCTEKKETEQKEHLTQSSHSYDF